MKFYVELAISSLIITSLRYRRNKDVNFDWVEALKTKGDTGVSLQYGHARLYSLMEKSREEYFNEDGELKHKVDYEYILYDPVALDLTLHLAK